MPARADIGRTILVLEERPQLWGIMGGRVSPATAYVRAAAPGELRTAWARCQPWPWLVVGTTAEAPAGLVELLDTRPIPVHWLGDPPALPWPAVAHASWQDLVAELEGLNGLCLEGVRLLRNRGLTAPDGRLLLDVPELEGLLAAGPHGLRLPQLSQPLQGKLQGARLPLRLQEAGGRLRLVPASRA